MGDVKVTGDNGIADDAEFDGSVADRDRTMVFDDAAFDGVGFDDMDDATSPAHTSGDGLFEDAVRPDGLTRSDGTTRSGASMDFGLQTEPINSALFDDDAPTEQPETIFEPMDSHLGEDSVTQLVADSTDLFSKEPAPASEKPATTTGVSADAIGSSFDDVTQPYSADSNRAKSSKTNGNRRKIIVTAVVIVLVIALVAGVLWIQSRKKQSDALSQCQSSSNDLSQVVRQYTSDSVEKAKSIAISDVKDAGTVSALDKAVRAVEEHGDVPSCSAGDTAKVLESTAKTMDTKADAMRKAVKAAKAVTASHNALATGTVRETAQAKYDAAVKMLDDSKGKVADEATRDSLAQAINNAKGLLADKDADEQELQQTADALQNAIDAVADSMNKQADADNNSNSSTATNNGGSSASSSDSSTNRRSRGSRQTPRTPASNDSGNVNVPNGPAANSGVPDSGDPVPAAPAAPSDGGVGDTSPAPSAPEPSSPGTGGDVSQAPSDGGDWANAPTQVVPRSVKE